MFPCPQIVSHWGKEPSPGPMFVPRQTSQIVERIISRIKLLIVIPTNQVTIITSNDDDDDVQTWAN